MGLRTNTHRAISFRIRIPLRPLPGSSVFVVTRSILDMMLIQGTSRLTIADMAERTPLWVGGRDGSLDGKQAEGLT